MDGRTYLMTLELISSKPQLLLLFISLPTSLTSGLSVRERKKEEELGSCSESEKRMLVGGILLAKDEPMLVKKELKEFETEAGWEIKFSPSDVKSSGSGVFLCLPRMPFISRQNFLRLFFSRSSLRA